MPDAHREALAERARRDLDPGRLVHVGVALERRADLAEALEVLVREVAVVGKRRVLDRRRMALAEDEAVALVPGRILRVVAKHAVVERGDDVGGRERGIEVARLRDGQHPHAGKAVHRGPALELGDRSLARAASVLLRRRVRIRNRAQMAHRREVTVSGPIG